MGWFIAGGVLLFIAALTFIPIKFFVRYDDEFKLYVKILFVKIGLYPSKPQKIRLSDYKPENIRKRQATEAKTSRKKLLKEQKKASRAAKKAAGLPEPPAETGLADLISLLIFVKNLASEVLRRFAGYVRVDLRKLEISVAAGDAAKTATLYGAVSPTVYIICELLREARKFDTRQISNVAVTADFLGETSSVKVDIIFSLKVWQILFLALRAGFMYMKKLFAGG